MSGFIYPISMGWQWGGGWLASAGFSDFAGSTLVHACGGAAALAGVIVLGARPVDLLDLDLKELWFLSQHQVFRLLLRYFPTLVWLVRI